MRPAWVIIGVALVVASACARTDWIDRTLVTVDVTGVWEGTETPTSARGTENPIELVLEQKGAKVSGELKGVRNLHGVSSPATIQIEGTMSGDTFSFHAVNPGPTMQVVLQVKGDEMTGEAQGLARVKMTFRRRQ